MTTWFQQQAILYVQKLNGGCACIPVRKRVSLPDRSGCCNPNQDKPYVRCICVGIRPPNPAPRPCGSGCGITTPFPWKMKQQLPRF